MTEENNAYLPPAEHCFFAPGHVCGFLQITPGQLRHVMEETGTRFAMVLDNVPMLDGHGLETVAERCRVLRAEIQTAAAKMDNAPSN